MLPHITVTIDHNKPIDAPCPARVQTRQKIVEVELTRDLIEAFQAAGNITVIEIPLVVPEPVVEAAPEAEPVMSESDRADSEEADLADLAELGDAAIEEVTADEDPDDEAEEDNEDEEDEEDEDADAPSDDDDLDEEA